MKAKEIEEFEELLNDAHRWAFVGWDINFVAKLQDQYSLNKGDMDITEMQLLQLERIANW